MQSLFAKLIYQNQNQNLKSKDIEILKINFENFGLKKKIKKKGGKRFDLPKPFECIGDY